MCSVVAGALKAVDVKTENATEDFAHLNAFCIKDRGESTMTLVSGPRNGLRSKGKLKLCVP